MDFKYPAFLVKNEDAWTRWKDVPLDAIQDWLDDVDNMPAWEVELFLEWIEEGCEWIRDAS